MKIALASDVHLEFGTTSFNNTDNADVLILSGDICVANNFHPTDKKFFELSCTTRVRMHKLKLFRFC